MAASVADQGVASSTNFVLNILLARWLVVRDYGAFSVSWSFLLILAAFHNALVLEPMTVVGPADFGGRMSAYFRANNRLNWLVVLVLAGIGLLFALIYKDPVVRYSLLVMSFCAPGYFLLLVARRKQYVVNKPLRALGLSLVYAALVFGFFFLCRLTGRLSAVTGVAALGMAWFALLLARSWSGKSTPDGDAISLKEILREHWRYGKWIFASALLAIGASDLQTLLLSMLVDIKAAGALRALMNFVLPLSQLLTVLSIYALPRLSSRAKQGGAHKLLLNGMALPLGFAGLMAVYLGALLLLAPRFEQLLYAGRMHAYIKWIPLLAASTFVTGLGGALSTLLRAIQNSQHIFIAGITGSAVGVAAAFLLQRNMGIEGALLSLLAANSVSTLIIAGTYFWCLKRSKELRDA